MTKTEQIIYRRRRLSFTWHYREDCKRFPAKDYIEEPSNTNIQPQMVCLLCKGLDRRDKLSELERLGLC